MEQMLILQRRTIVKVHNCSFETRLAFPVKHHSKTTTKQKQNKNVKYLGKFRF